MQRVAVINVVGLSPSLLGPSTPRLKAFADKHGLSMACATTPGSAVVE